jgi:hypothetical protein
MHFDATLYTAFRSYKLFSQALKERIPSVTAVYSAVFVIRVVKLGFLGR